MGAPLRCPGPHLPSREETLERRRSYHVRSSSIPQQFQAAGSPGRTSRCPIFPTTIITAGWDRNERHRKSEESAGWTGPGRGGSSAIRVYVGKTTLTFPPRSGNWDSFGAVQREPGRHTGPGRKRVLYELDYLIDADAELQYDGPFNQSVGGTSSRRLGNTWILGHSRLQNVISAATPTSVK